MDATIGSTESVRQYFAKLTLQGQGRAGLVRWSTLPVETFFVALRLSASAINHERRPSGPQPQTLGELFAAIRWE